jgi:hypothetical protein
VLAVASRSESVRAAQRFGWCPQQRRGRVGDRLAHRERRRWPEKTPPRHCLGRVGPLRTRRPFDAGLGRRQDSHGGVVVSVPRRGGGIVGDLSPPRSGHGALLPLLVPRCHTSDGGFSWENTGRRENSEGREARLYPRVLPEFLREPLELK